MAKLWEVLKAFDEGTSVEAERTTDKDQRVSMLYNGIDKMAPIATYLDGEYHASYLREQDISATDWRILDKPDHRVFDVVYATFELRGRKGPSKTSVTFQDMSLLKVQRIVGKQYPDAIISVLSSVGVSKSGAITILVQEGKMVE